MAGQIQLAAQHGIELQAQDFVQQAQFDAKIEQDKKRTEIMQNYMTQTAIPPPEVQMQRGV